MSAPASLSFSLTPLEYSNTGSVTGSISTVVDPVKQVIGLFGSYDKMEDSTSESIPWDHDPRKTELTDKHNKFWKSCKKMNDSSLTSMKAEETEESPDTKKVKESEHATGVNYFSPVEDRMINRVRHVAKNLISMGGWNLENLMRLMTNVTSTVMRFPKSMKEPIRQYHRSRMIHKTNRIMEICFGDVNCCVNKRHLFEDDDEKVKKELKHWSLSAPLCESDPLIYQDTALGSDKNKYYTKGLHNCTANLDTKDKKGRIITKGVHPDGDLKGGDLFDPMNISFERNGDLEHYFLLCDDITQFFDVIEEWRQANRELNESIREEENAFKGYQAAANNANFDVSSGGTPGAPVSIQRKERNAWIKFLRVLCVAMSRVRAFYFVNSLVEKAEASSVQSQDAVDALALQMSNTSLDELEMDEVHKELERFGSVAQQFVFPERCNMGNLIDTAMPDKEVKMDYDSQRPFNLTIPLVICPIHAWPRENSRFVEDDGFLPGRSNVEPVIRLGHFIPDPYAKTDYMRECMCCLTPEAYAREKAEEAERAAKIKRNDDKEREERVKKEEEKAKEELKQVESENKAAKASISGPSTASKYSLKAKRNKENALAKFKEEMSYVSSDEEVEEEEEQKQHNMDF